jgi:hypothetical protein
MTAKERLRERIEALTEDADTLRLLDQRSEQSDPSVFPIRPGRPITAAQFERHFGHLPIDEEGLRPVLAPPTSGSGLTRPT